MHTNKIITFYLVRHGETEWNKQGLVIGQSESVLTEKGRDQARELREQFSDINFDIVFSSDLERAVETAKIIVDGKNVEVHTSELLREKKMGIYEGQHLDILKFDNKKMSDSYRMLSEEEKWKFKRSADMESLEEICNRVLILLHKITVDYPEKTILLVSHEAVLQSLLIYLNWGTQKEVQGGYVENCGYIKLNFNGKDFLITETEGVFKKIIVPIRN